MPKLRLLKYTTALGLFVTICYAFEVEMKLKNITHLMGPTQGDIETTDTKELHIFCRRGELKKLNNYFKTASLRILSAAEDIKILKGSSPEEVYFKYKHTTLWGIWASNLFPWRVRDTSYPTFNSSCIGITSSKPYTASLVQHAFDPWSFIIFASGVALFIFAPKLVESATFFYTSGTVLGALGAALVFIFIMYRILPKGRISYFSICALWSFFLYFAGETWNRIEEFLQEKLAYLLIYLTIGAVVAFVTCYRIGPPTNPRTLDMMRWALQGLGLGLIYLCSDLTEISTAIIVLMIFSYSFAQRIYYFCQKFWRKTFPPKIRLLTEEEYMAQASAETQKGLEELRAFCSSSPKCSTWKLVLRLKNPKRFSEFVEGSSHLSDDELMCYESDSEPESVTNGNGNDLLTDDDDSLGLITEECDSE